MIFPLAILVALSGLAHSAHAQAAPPNLADLGFSQSSLAKVEGGLAIYRLGSRGSMAYFAIVRSIESDEPILRFAVGRSQVGQQVTVYGPREAERMASLVGPLVELKGRMANVTIYHYAKGVTLERHSDSRFPWNDLRDPLTGQPVAVPAAAETWTGTRRALTEPFTWHSGSEFFGTDSTDLNTLNAIRGVQRAVAARRLEGTRKRDSILASERAEVEARRAKAVARQEERARLIVAAGLLHQPDEFWAQYRLGPEFRAIFDGAWPEATRAWEFGNLYDRTFREYSSRCRRLIPAGSPQLITKRVSYSDLGTPSAGPTDTVFIPAAYAEPFRWADDNSPRALAMGPPGLNARKVEDLLGQMLNVGATLNATMTLTRFYAAMRNDFSRLFEGGCETPIVRQYLENLRRLALGIPTLQAELAPRSMPTAEERPAPIEPACQRHIARRGQSVPRNWCACIERAAAASMLIGERWSVATDYYRFFDEVDGFLPGADGKPIQARTAIADACR